MSPDSRSDTPAGIAQADPLYQSFPDFSAWGGLPPVDADLWDRFAASLNERRKSATPEALRSAVEVTIRAAALDTGAIEGLYTVDRGFTMTVAFQSLAWEQAIEERGAGVRELFEAQLEAYELVLDAVTQKLPITEAWIRALHEKLVAPQRTYRVLTEVGWQEQELPKGQYKTRPNHVRLTDGTFHAYAPVDRVPEEMHRLVEQLQTPEFESAHPILQASYCHYAFVVIHPFADGNGRVARALASTFFYRAQSIPLVIFANQRPAYLDVLHAADLRNYRPVIAFFRDRGIDTMQLVAESLFSTEDPPLEIMAAKLNRLLYPREGFSREALDSLALRLQGEVNAQARAQFDRLSLPKEVSLSFTEAEDSRGALLGYRRLMQKPKPITLVRINNNSSPSAQSGAGAQIRILVAQDENNPFTFLIEAVGGSESLEIRLEDVSPELSPVLALRLAGWTQRLLRRLLGEFEKRSQASFKERE